MSCDGCKCDGRDAADPNGEVRAILLDVASDLASASIGLDGAVETLSSSGVANGQLALEHAGYLAALSTISDLLLGEIRKVATEPGL